MLRCALIALLTAAPQLAATSALAADDKPPVILRFVGEAAGIGEDGPSRFVIDAVASPSDEGGYEVTGWLGSLPPQNDNGEVKGKCAGQDCDLTVEMSSRQLALSGRLFGASGPSDGGFALKGDLVTATRGAVRFTPFTDAAPGLGTLAKPGAIDSRTLDDLLIWQNVDPVFFDDGNHPLDDTAHEHIASWQQSASRPINGLVLVEDLALLKAKRDAAQKAAGWTLLGSLPEGWSAGYPAALLPKASQSGAEHRFESADGKASLVIAFEPPMSDDAFDTLVDKVHDEAKAAADESSFSFTRAGSNMEYSYTKGDQVFEARYYARKRGMARLLYVHPKADGPLSDIGTAITGSLHPPEDE